MEYRGFLIGRRLLKSLVIVLGVVLAVMATSGLRAQTTPAFFRVSNASSSDINLIQFKRADYVGQCPGTGFSPNVISARFASTKTPPAPNRRVVIQNVTPGMETDPYPYTDRSYDRGELSEDFELRVSKEHKTRSFSVLEGENKFSYQIKENEQVIEEGSFTAQVSIQNLGVFSREAICEEKLECRNNSDCYDRDGKRKRSGDQRCYKTRSCHCP